MQGIVRKKWYYCGIVPVLLSSGLVCCVFGQRLVARERQVPILLAQVGPGGDITRRDLARLRADVNQIREDQVKLLARIDENRQRINALVRQVQQLEMRVGGAAGSGETAHVEKRLQALEKALRQEVEAREKAVDGVITSVSKEIARVLNRSDSGGGRRIQSDNIQGEYTVQRGDTLGAIAQAFGVSVKQLKAANGLENDLIIEGQKLVIPKE